jgi:hypothetical protein
MVMTREPKQSNGVKSACKYAIFVQTLVQLPEIFCMPMCTYAGISIPYNLTA